MTTYYRVHAASAPAFSADNAWSAPWGSSFVSPRFYVADNGEEDTGWSVVTLAKGISYARKWLHATPAHTTRVVFNRVNLFCRCWVIGDSIHFPNGVIVE